MTQIKIKKARIFPSGEQFFPITHTNAVIDDNGYTAESRLGAMQDEINQAQLAVGAVPSDLTPTEDSNNWVTSGGVYNAIQGVHAEVTELEGLITEPNTEVSLIPYSNVMYTINASGVWATTSNTNHSIFVPMQNGEYTLTAPTSTPALYTVLTSNDTPTAGATPAYATGYSNRISIPAGGTVTVQGTSGLYLWMRNDTSTSGAMAPAVMYNSGGSRLDAIAQLVPEPVNTSLYSTIYFIIKNTTNKWVPSDSISSLFKSKIIPMQDGEYTLSAVNGKSVYTVLSSNTPVDGETPAYATGYDKQITIEQGNSEKVKGKSGLYLYIRSDDDAIYGAISPEIKFLAYSERINPIEDFINNIKTYETPGNNTDAIILGYSPRGNDIYIAASDSSEVAKVSADFVCDGVNDEIELRDACLALTGNGVLHMAEGNYYVDSFFTTADGGQPYIMKPKLEQNNITIVCDFNQPIKSSSGGLAADDITLGAIIRITDDCYNSLDSDTLYTIIRACASNGSRKYPLTFLNVRGIGFKIPDNQKQIICIDGYFATAMNINRCTFNFIQDSRQPSSLHNGVMNCIGIRGTQGDIYGVYNHITDCVAWGCGQGFAIGGEHLLVDQCLTRFCRYGYTFNNYSIAAGRFIHPIILLNCSDEASFNLPLFGNNEWRQAIYMYGFNIEHQSQYFNLFPTEGNYMRELTPGQWRGRVEFTMNIDHNANVIDYRLWATDGSGVNVKSINDAQKFICTTSERNSYYPTAGQIVYDTTLGKPVMCIDAVNKTWVDFTGATV